MASHADGSRAQPAAEGSLTLQLLRALQSVRVTIYLLPILAIATTIGAIIPQGRAPEYYEMIYGATRGRIVVTLGLHGLYNSTWFIALIALLLLNLAACAARSWRRTLTRYRGPSPATLARKFGDGGRACWSGESATSHAANRLSSALRRARYAVAETAGKGGATWLLVRRWPLAYFGSIVTHLAIFLIAAGAVLGCLPWTSLDTNVTLAEGDTHRDESGDLGFDVRLDDFRMDFYEETGTPSSYESDLTLTVGGREVQRGTATVNSQLVYGGVALGQSSWGLAGIRLAIESDEGTEEEAVLRLTEAAGPHGDTTWTFEQMDAVAMVEGKRAAVVATAFVPDAVEQDGEIVGSASQYPRAPAVALQLATGLGGGEHEFHDLGWVRLGETASAAGYRVRFADLAYISTLSARRDPGLPFVWAGAILVSLGMIVVFYVRPRAFLVELTEPEASGVTYVRVAPAGRELASADRRLIERACGVKLGPLTPAATRSESR